MGCVKPDSELGETALVGSYISSVFSGPERRKEGAKNVCCLKSSQ